MAHPPHERNTHEPRFLRVSHSTLLPWCLVFTLCTAPFVQGVPVISEFLADNTTDFKDEDEDEPDWIKIHNPDGGANVG